MSTVSRWAPSALGPVALARLYPDDECTRQLQALKERAVADGLYVSGKPSSDKTLEQIVSALNRMADEPAVRGTMIQQ